MSKRDKLFVIYLNGERVSTNSNAYISERSAKAGITHLSKKHGIKRDKFKIKKYINKDNVGILDCFNISWGNENG